MEILIDCIQHLGTFKHKMTHGCCRNCRGNTTARTASNDVFELVRSYGKRDRTNFYTLYRIGLFNIFHFLVFYPDRAHKDFNITSPETAILIMVLGATHILARPLLGLMGNKNTSVFKKQLIYAGCTVSSGLICCLSVFFSNMPLQILFIIIYGVSSGK